MKGLAGAVHNVDRGHTPVLIFAGAAPQSADRRIKGAKNEWPMWLQGSSSISLYPRLSDNLPQMSRTSQLLSAST